jgi:hypothetical protein
MQGNSNNQQEVDEFALQQHKHGRWILLERAVKASFHFRKEKMVKVEECCLLGCYAMWCELNLKQFR